MFCMHMPDRCGAFFHDVAAARILMSRGHTVTFIYTQRSPGLGLTGHYRNVPFKHYSYADKELASADIFTTPHYPIVSIVRKLNEKYQKPIVMTCHFAENTQSLLPYEQVGKWADIVVYVSNHMKRFMEEVLATNISPTIKRSAVLYPIMVENEITLPETRPEGQYITLVNGNLLKGVDVFLRIANEMIDHQFLGIRAYYSKTAVHNTDNVTWENYSDDIRLSLSKTRVLLVPSLTESWSRIAFEAMYNGIPVLYTKPYRSDRLHSGTTEAMAEWIGDAAIACDRYNIGEWVEALRQLDDPEFYAEMSRRARARAIELDMFHNIDRYEHILKETIRDFPAKNVQEGIKAKMTGNLATQSTSIPNLSATGQRLGFQAGRFGVRKR